MDVRRNKNKNQVQVQASDALPLPIRHTNKLFSFVFLVSLSFLMPRWREKISNSTPLHLLTLSEMIAALACLSSVIYLISFFGIDYVQSFISDPSHDEEEEHDFNLTENNSTSVANPNDKVAIIDTLISADFPLDDQEIVNSVISGKIPSYSLEEELDDTYRAVKLRREAIKRITGRRIEGLPVDGFDYNSILGQCCELPIGYVQLPVGFAGPLILDGVSYYVPMATTEGCLVASVNRGCKAIAESGGATSVVFRDGMSRAPVVGFGSVTRAAELKFFLEEPANFDTLALVFNRTSRFGRLQEIQCTLAGRYLYMRFICRTGDAMGMNMVSKGVQNVLEYLQSYFPDMDVISISGNLCSDKKASAVNWIEGRGKSVVCEAIIKEETVKKVLKTSARVLVDLNIAKNLVGSAMAGALGGFNAQASNVVTAVFIATGQDPAQNVESSHCITMMEVMNDGKDLHISVTMPCIEVGTVGGGTHLASQSACLDILGVKGANMESPGANARRLAAIVAGAVLAGELSLMSALATGQLVNSHMRYNRSSRDIATVAPP